VPGTPLTSLESAITQCRVDDGFDLSTHDPRATLGWEKEDAIGRFPEEIAAVAELQKRLYAASNRAMLVVLQAIDAGGKGGTIRSVMSGLNPAGVDVNGFGVPSEEERAHDFLWRVHEHVPAFGRIGIFDRSHYEDVLVVRVKRLVAEPVWRGRYQHIVNFERLLHDEGTTVVKLFLNISKEEQRARFQDRIDDPEERWKFRAGDLADRALWDEYQAAFADALGATSTETAPWYVVPGDRKWVRNLVVAAILRHHLAIIDPQYPEAEAGVEGMVIE
jgi:PPK2 family polyphosphate:nucleotide phosphotransferase